MNKNPNYTIVREMKGYTRADLEKERNEIYMRRQGKEGGGTTVTAAAPNRESAPFAGKAFGLEAAGLTRAHCLDKRNQKNTEL